MTLRRLEGRSDPVVLPNGFVLDAATFYRERDQRTTVDYAQPSDAFRVAVVLASASAETREVHTSLFWTCSMVRRMGRRFAQLVIIAEPSVLDLPFQGAPNSSLTVAEALEQELLGADPFAPIEWRRFGAEDAFAGVTASIWLGDVPDGPTRPPAHGRHVRLAAKGWVAALEWLARDGTSALSSAGFPVARQGGAAPATVVFAAALAVSAVYRAAHTQTLGDGAIGGRTVWVALDSGNVTSEPEAGARWLDHGASIDSAAPWEDGSLGVPRLEHLTIVGAGALGGNAARILALSSMSTGAVTLLDHDAVDLSNLNRLIGVVLGHFGIPKVAPVIEALTVAGIVASGSAEPYERWSARGQSGGFRATGHAVLVGVDQVRTRLNIQADWPALLVNGGTSGTNWSVSIHRPGTGACVGCHYGSAPQFYAMSRRAVACGGVGGHAIQNVDAPMASYPFVSVAAAAMMVAALIQAVWNEGVGHSPVDDVTSTVRRLSMLRPESGVVGHIVPHDGCLLLCGKEYVQPVFIAHPGRRR